MARKLRYNDEEGGMIKAQLMKIESYAAKLNDMIHPDDEIEGWVQAKLAVVAAYMGDVKHYLDYELKEAFGDGGSVGSKPRHWEVEFTWDGEEEGDGRKVNVMAESVADAERQVKDKFGPYYKGLRIVEVEEDKEMSWDEYAASKSKKRKKFEDYDLDEMTRTQIENDEQQLRREQGFAGGGEMKGLDARYNSDKIYKYAVRSNYVIGFQGREDVLYFKSEQEAKNFVKQKPSMREYLGTHKMADGGLLEELEIYHKENGPYISESELEYYLRDMKAKYKYVDGSDYGIAVLASQLGYVFDEDADQYVKMADGGKMAKGGTLTDTAYKRRIKKWGFQPYGKTKGKYTIEYDADGEKQSEIWETKEMAVNSARRYKKYGEFSNVKIKDESGNIVEFADGGEMAKSGKYYAVYNLNGDFNNGVPLYIITDTKEEMVNKLNKKYLELTGEKKAPYSIDDMEDVVYMGKKLDHFIADDWASVTNNKQVFKNDISYLKNNNKMAEGGEVMVELIKRGHKKDRAEKLVKKHTYLIDVADDAKEAADDIEKYDAQNEFPEVPQLKFSHGGDIDEDEVDVEEQRDKAERMYEADREEEAIRQIEKRDVKLQDLMRYDDLYFVGHIFDTDSDGWVSKYEAEKIIDDINANRYDDGGEIKKVFVEITKPSEISLNRVKRQVEQFAQAGYRSADILLKMAFVTDRPKLLEDQFQKLKNSVYYFRDVKKYYRGGKMEDEFLRYEGSSFFDDYQEAKQYLGESTWKEMSYEDRVEATKYLKATGKIGYIGEYEDLETVAATMYKKGGSVGKFLVVVNQRKTNTVSKMLVNSLGDIDKRQFEVLSVKKLG